MTDGVTDAVTDKGAQTHELTQLLIDWSNGDRAALDKLVPLIDEQLRRLAHRYMRQERAGHTLQTTASRTNEAICSRLLYRLTSFIITLSSQ